MKTIEEVYRHYKIPLNLQQHMLRVAAVGKLIAENLKESSQIDMSILMPALLLHDMRNIIKFNLDDPEQYDEDVTILRAVKAEYLQKYGEDEHKATDEIAKELGMSARVLSLIAKSDRNKFTSSSHAAVESDDVEFKIKEYADLRIGPYGLLSITQRFDDIVKRYTGRWHELSNIDHVELRRKYALLLEEQIQSLTKIDLQQIKNAQIENDIPNLARYSIM